MTRCANCGAERTEARPDLCPRCGATGKRLVHVHEETVGITETGAGFLARRRAVLARFPWLRHTLTALNWGGPFLGLVFDQVSGLVVGLALAGVAQLLGPFLAERIYVLALGRSAHPSRAPQNAAQKSGGGGMRPAGTLQPEKLPHLEDDPREPPHGGAE